MRSPRSRQGSAGLFQFDQDTSKIFDGRSCFAQWQDVGPCGEDDFDFVFGNATMPRNAFDTRAGLDVSPAVRHYLGMSHNELTYWRFADKADIPEGPWAEIVTTSGNNR